MDESYRVSCLWYRKVLNKYVLPLPQCSLPVYPPFVERSPEHNHSMEDDKILNEEKEYGARIQLVYQSERGKALALGLYQNVSIVKKVYLRIDGVLLIESRGKGRDTMFSKYICSMLNWH